jgi:hypothetical protein
MKLLEMTKEEIEQEKMKIKKQLELLFILFLSVLFFASILFDIYFRQ